MSEEIINELRKSAIDSVFQPNAIFYPNETWIDLIRSIVFNGELRQPTGATQKLSVELLGYKTIWPMSCPLLTLSARKLSYRFAAAEAGWILSGDDRVSTIQEFAPKIAQYSDDGSRFFGAYGPMVKGQFNYVVNCLTEDQSSRQAVISIWRPNPPKSKDIPCTLSLQFLLRKTSENTLLLSTIAYMRSSDAWLGTPYDVFNFSIISLVLASELQLRTGKHIRLGTLTLFTGSHHLYIDDIEMIDKRSNLINSGIGDFKQDYLVPSSSWLLEEATDRLWRVSRAMPDEKLSNVTSYVKKHAKK